MKRKKDEIKGKKLYIKPKLTQVKLVVGEAVLGYCKIGGTSPGAFDICAPDECNLAYRS